MTNHKTFATFLGGFLSSISGSWFVLLREKWVDLPLFSSRPEEVQILPPVVCLGKWFTASTSSSVQFAPVRIRWWSCDKWRFAFQPVAVGDYLPLPRLDWRSSLHHLQWEWEESGIILMEMSLGMLWNVDKQSETNKRKAKVEFWWSCFAFHRPQLIMGR